MGMAVGSTSYNLFNRTDSFNALSFFVLLLGENFSILSSYCTIPYSTNNVSVKKINYD